MLRISSAYLNKTDAATILGFIKAGAADQAPGTTVAATESRLLSTLHFQDEDLSGNSVPKFGWPLIIYSPDGRAAGLAIYYHNYSTWAAEPGICLEELYVVPDYRSLGYARLLIEAVARRGRETGCIKLDWLCLRNNHRALRFYEKIGAKVMEDWAVLKVNQQSMEKLANSSRDTN
jgi:GNAT superfamily N-acetyltransferase